MQGIPRDILIQASEGSMLAFEKIYRDMSGFVYNVSLRITNNADDAKDVTQDVFIKIHKNLKRFRFRSSFKTWVYRITANAAINTLKRNSREIGRRVDCDIALKSKDGRNTVTQGIDRKANERLLSSLLGILNPDQRACIVLREIEGLGYKEISAALNININTVRSRLKRARAVLLARGKRGEQYEL